MRVKSNWILIVSLLNQCLRVIHLRTQYILLFHSLLSASLSSLNSSFRTFAVSRMCTKLPFIRLSCGQYPALSLNSLSIRSSILSFTPYFSQSEPLLSSIRLVSSLLFLPSPFYWSHDNTIGGAYGATALIRTSFHTHTDQYLPSEL